MPFMLTVIVIFTKTQRERQSRSYPPFTDEETEDQTGKMTYIILLSKWVAELRLRCKFFFFNHLATRMGSNNRPTTLELKKRK